MDAIHLKPATFFCGMPSHVLNQICFKSANVVLLVTLASTYCSVQHTQGDPTSVQLG